jgi:hypothetical protein
MKLQEIISILPDGFDLSIIKTNTDSVRLTMFDGRFNHVIRIISLHQLNMAFDDDGIIRIHLTEMISLLNDKNQLYRQNGLRQARP